MSTGLLEEVGIADTMFGENQVLEVQDDFSADIACFCVCGCVSSADKLSNSSAVNANSFVAEPNP
jgi:hypothetical protein